MNPHLMKSNGAPMIRRSLMLVAALAVVSTSPVVAHEGHDHDEDLTDKQVAQIAAKALPSVIQSKKLSSAWSKAQRQEVTAESINDKVVWVVSYKNPDGKADGGSDLYLYFDDLGNYVDANQTGKAPAK
jgi:Family of unknown function (DUF6488)